MNDEVWLLTTKDDVWLLVTKLDVLIVLFSSVVTRVVTELDKLENAPVMFVFKANELDNELGTYAANIEAVTEFWTKDAV